MAKVVGLMCTFEAFERFGFINQEVKTNNHWYFKDKFPVGIRVNDKLFEYMEHREKIDPDFEKTFSKKVVDIIHSKFWKQ